MMNGAIAETPRLSGLKVLVIDDSKTIRRTAETLLAKEGCEVFTAVDGFDALSKIADHQPDIVFVDIMMPRLDGFGVIEQLRASPETQDLPIIVISAKELTNEEARKLKESVAFIMKKQGFDGEKLTQEINNILNF